MSQTSTFLAQLLKQVPRSVFDALARQHHAGQALRKTCRWDQFIALLMAQLSGRQSLRDIEANLRSQRPLLACIGAHPIARSSLARLNHDQPSALFEALFQRLLPPCQAQRGPQRFRFKSPLYALDASLIGLSLPLFPWARVSTTKAAVKLHVGLHLGGQLPEFVALTRGHESDLRAGRRFDFPAGSMVVCDKGYVDYGWYRSLTDRGVFFVTRLKARAVYRVAAVRNVVPGTGVTLDQCIELNGINQKQNAPQVLRRVGYRDAESGRDYEFLTNRFDLAARTIADIYKARWQVELFFKAIKQNLKIHAFVGQSLNAVMTQLWIALIAWLLLWRLKVQSGSSWSLQRLMRVVQMNVFAKRDVLALARGTPPPGPRLAAQPGNGW